MLTILSNKKLSVSIDSKGAEIVGITNLLSQQNYIWEGNPTFWGKHAPILFPIVGSLKNNSYIYKGESYTLNRHGFARDLDFELEFSSSQKVVFKLQSDASTKSKYPFDFTLLITYTLEETTVRNHFEVINHGNEIMPFSIGGHPAFMLTHPFEEYQLQFDGDETLSCFPLVDGLISDSPYTLYITNGILPLDYQIFEKDALVIKQLNSKKITIKHLNQSVLSVHLNDFKNLGIWTMKNAPFICIEPWLGYSDTENQSGNLFQKEWIQLLNPNSTLSYCFDIEIL